MSVHVQTGNQLDVVLATSNGKEVITGLQRWGTAELIPLLDPQGLVEVLQRILKENE